MKAHTWTMKNAILIAVCGILAAFLQAGCDNNNQSPLESQTEVPIYELIGQIDGMEALALANEWRVSKSDIYSRLKVDEITFSFPEGHELSIPLPSDKMAVAIAPYETYTHPCAIHSISGCRGELVDVDTKVLAVDQEGTVLVDETFRTADNGFFELWLPRNSDISLTLEANGKKAKGVITTYETSNTCVTTFMLE